MGTQCGSAGEDQTTALAKLRGILVSSLSRENLSPQDQDGDSPPPSPPQSLPLPLPPVRRRRKVHFSETHSMSVDCLATAGAAPENQTTNSRPSSAKQGKENAASQRDREERLRFIKEKQNEERQKKLDELKQQALAAQKFREQKEEERRRRMEELRLRDTDRRHQVEERKRQIWEAERERREAILRKNQERETRIETKRRNERSQIVFAFGSSTPRMLEPADTGGSYWASRRATSTSNVMTLSMSAVAAGVAAVPLTRRSSERELDSAGTKKRAISAGGIHRKQAGDEGVGEHEESGTMTPVPAAGASSARAARRKTDLMPTLPSPRDLTPRGLPTRSPGSGLRSGEITPSRPTSSLSQHSMSSAMSSSVHAAFRPRPTPRRPRPFSIHVTGVTASASAATDSPTLATIPGTATATARHSLSSEHRATKSPSTSSVSDKDKPPLPKVHAPRKPAVPKPTTEAAKKPTDKVKSTKSSATASPKATATPLASPGVAESTVTTSVVATTVSSRSDSAETLTTVTVEETHTVTPAPVLLPVTEVQEVPVKQEPEPTAVPVAISEPAKDDSIKPAIDLAECDMTASMLAKTRITTEEEAKAALAERRRLAREQAEREAELERQRLEAERLAEEVRLREEEEEQRRQEEEQLRLLEEARQAEQERLNQAIEEAQKREEEERLQREIEAKEKVEKEEAEKKAREEAEKQRKEMEIRLKKEEEDRLERRKRVEAIMSRTRGKGSSSANTPTKDGDESPVGREGEMSQHEQFLHSERSHSAANNIDVSVKQNGHQNGVDNVVEQKNVTNNLLDFSIEGMGMSQPITDQILVPNTMMPTNGKLTNEDSVNFNTAPPSNPFITNPFQDNKKQDTVNDLLS